MIERHIKNKHAWTIAAFVALSLTFAVAIFTQGSGNEVLAGQKTPESKQADLTKALAALDSTRIVDMSHTFDDTTIYWPTDKPFRWEKRAWGPTVNGYWYASANYAASEHGGTHLDSPIHFAEKGDTTEKIAISRLIGPAIVIDISKACAENPNHELTEIEVEGWESQHGKIDGGSIVVVRTGWGKRWPDKKTYLGTDIPGDVANLQFPGVGAKAAELLKNRGVKGVAIDTASLDRGMSKEFESHRILNAANIYGIENLANAETLPARGSILIALPMKIGGGSGGPVRVMGILPGR
jgi:kynurenine formamidase